MKTGKMKRDPRIDAYILKAAPFARPILRKLRASVHAACPQAEETVKWRMPFFVIDGKILCHMAAFTAHASFGFWRGRTQAIPAAARVRKEDEGMGQLGRLTSLADLPSDAKLRSWIKKAAALGAAK